MPPKTNGRKRKSLDNDTEEKQLIHCEPELTMKISFNQKSPSRESSSSEDSENLSDEYSDTENKTDSDSKRVKLFGISESEDANNASGENVFTDNSWMRRNLCPHIHHFDVKHTGIKANLDESSTILDYFQLFFSEYFMSFVTEETNNFHKYTMEKAEYPIKSRLHNWKDATLNEMYSFLAITLLMSRMKKLSYAEYWSKDRLLRTDAFGEIMSRDRYLIILQMLNFSDTRLSNSEDRLYKIREVVHRLRESFKACFYPFENLCIVESFQLFKERMSFENGIQRKKNGSGFKSFVLCDCQTGYIQDFLIDVGCETDTSVNPLGIGKSGDVVLRLLQPYLGKGHRLYVDDFYTSPALFMLLHGSATNACGMVKKSQKGMPAMADKLKKGEMCFRSTSNLLALKWHDRREVWMLSTCHSAEFTSTGKKDHRTQEVSQKPTCVLDYNLWMSAVDKNDMVVSTIQATRKSVKWYKKYFFHMLDISVWNAYCLYRTKMDKKLTVAQFHIQLIREILQKYHQDNNKSNSGRRGNEDCPLRLTGRHFASAYKRDTTKRRNPVRKCVVCSKNEKRRESRYCCRICDVGLCIDPCFEIYHTELNY